MKQKLQELKERLLEVDDLQSAVSVLDWDQQTYMPPGGAATRGRHMATLGRLAHTKFTDPQIGKLLDDLQPYEESLPHDSDDASLIRVTRREYEKAVKVPPEFTAKLYAHKAESYDVWTRARPANDFASTQPYLEKAVELSRELADFFPGYEHIADPLIDLADYSMKATTVRSLFNELRAQLAPIVDAVTSQETADDSCLHQHFPEQPQLDFAVEIARQFGYDFQRGRLDKTPHPFMTQFSLGDVRITTRVKENNLAESLFSILHETGHALYEQGIRMELDGMPLAEGTSAGVHESQSRLWENLVGRSRGFWQHYYPKLQATFPNQFRAVAFDEFFRAVNKVERSLTRTDADEVTYNLHVMIRFDLELQMLEGTLAVKDLPEAWRERYQRDIGIAPPDHRDGVLQDMHWYGGLVGGEFQGYTLGNIMSALFFDAALQAHPEIPAEIEQGEFSTLHKWLKENIYQHGSKFTAPELIERVTGGPLTIEPYIRYLRSKYGELYNL